VRTTRLLGALTAALLTFGIASPAFADSGTTTATFILTGGTLSISVPATASFGSSPATVDAQIISGSLGQVQVNDARNPPAGSGWVVTVISAAFGGIAASAVSYTAGTITQLGTATYIANNPTNLTGVVAAITASGITGSNSATWTPTIHIAVPAGTIAGTYSALITHSVT
jgi:hypothetical protein